MLQIFLGGISGVYCIDKGNYLVDDLLLLFSVKRNVNVDKENVYKLRRIRTETSETPPPPIALHGVLFDEVKSAWLSHFKIQAILKEILNLICI